MSTVRAKMQKKCKKDEAIAMNTHGRTSDASINYIDYSFGGNKTAIYRPEQLPNSKTVDGVA